MAYVVGLTGGIGSGKSEATRAFAALGVEVADADLAAHAVTAQGTPGHAMVVEAFGTPCLAPDGELDRAWLRRTVFGDPAARRQLEAMLHPLIGKRLREEIAAWQGAYGILAVPLLLERGNVLPLVARVLVVDCPEDEQVRRVMQRNGMPAADVRAIMATQLARADRLARADDVIDNGGPREAVLPQVRRLDAFYRDRAGAGRTLEPLRRSPDNGAHAGAA
ncbi:MAG: dephospho-CoA kinase [Burkholderiales bacterium]